MHLPTCPAAEGIFFFFFSGTAVGGREKCSAAGERAKGWTTGAEDPSSLPNGCSYRHKIEEGKEGERERKGWGQTWRMRSFCVACH